MFKINRGCVVVLALLALFCSAAPLAAQDVYWTGGVGDFVDPANWDLFVPDVFSPGHINNGGTAQLGSPDFVEVSEFYLGDSAGDSGLFEMSGDQFVANKTVTGSAGNGSTTINGGDYTIGGGSIFVGWLPGGVGQMTIDGADTLVTSGDDFQLGAKGMVL